MYAEESSSTTGYFHRQLTENFGYTSKQLYEDGLHEQASICSVCAALQEMPIIAGILVWESFGTKS